MRKESCCCDYPVSYILMKSWFWFKQKKPRLAKLQTFWWSWFFVVETLTGHVFCACSFTVNTCWTFDFNKNDWLLLQCLSHNKYLTVQHYYNKNPHFAILYIFHSIKMKRRSRMQIIGLLCMGPSMMANAFMSPSTTSGHANTRHNIFDMRPMRAHSHGMYHKRIKHFRGRHSRNSMQLSATHDFYHLFQWLYQILLLLMQYYMLSVVLWILHQMLRHHRTHISMH